MNNQTPDSQNPYASPNENHADRNLDKDMPNLSESPIYYSGVVKPEEFAVAYALAIRGSWRAVRAAIAKVILCLLFLFLLGLTSLGIIYNNLLLFAVFMTLFAGYLILIIFRRIYWKIKIHDAWQKNLGCYQYTEGIIREDGFEVKSADGSSTIKWSCFKSIRHCESVAILYYAKQQGFCFFGRSKFKNDADWQRLISLLECKFPLG